MNTDRTEGPRTSDHGSFYIPFDTAAQVYFIDESNATVEQILDYYDYVPASPIDPDTFARSFDPRKIYHDQVRKITMESLSENGRIVGGPHRLPPKPILFADVEARKRALRTDGTQFDGPSGTVSWYYRADMALPHPILPTSSVLRFRNSLPSEEIGIDPLETIGGGDIPTWRGKEETVLKKGNKRFDPIQKHKKAGPKKHKE
jgi:hypothetical protein